MDITFTCPHCGEVTLIDETFIGQTGECRTCDRLVTVPKVICEPHRIESSADSIPSRNGLKWLWFFGAVVFLLLLIAIYFPIDQGRTAARRMSSANNLKQIALAMHNYHETYDHFPRAYWTTPTGERTLSWRVAILPFLESSSLFDRYRPDEPWDSPANQEVGKGRIYTYLGPWNRESSRDAGYLVITGPGTLFEEGRDISFNDCTDGTSNTILAVEVTHSGIGWTEPRDLDIRTMVMQINASDSNGIGSPWKNGAQVAMADGSVKFLSNKTLESTLRAMITRSGGGKINVPR